VQKVAMDNGVMLRASGPNILLSPPLIISEVDVGVILNAIDAGLTATS
jgi:adenosylmethionine-8-amino-7-oxononanoate aminotransferase